MPNFAVKAGRPVEYGYQNIKRAFEENSSVEEVLNSPLTDKNEMEQLLKSYKSQGQYRIPGAINYMVDATGGKIPAIDIINRQLKAHKLDQIPPETYRQVQEAQQSFGAYQDWIQAYPSRIRTDVAAIGSGQEPIYAQSTPAQDRIKEIFGKRESPTAGYDAINRGQPGDTPGGAKSRYGRSLTEMTVGEVKQLQAKELNAVGKYQFIAGTLKEAAERAGITDDMKFNEAVQDRMFFVHLDHYGAYSQWEKWWIQQGGQALALTPEEKSLIEAFRESYDPSKPWRQARNMNPSLIQAQAKANIGQNTGIQITSASDASGEPGSDFVISNGQRGAKFHFPYEAEVLKVVGDQNWESNLERGDTRRGYGNLVELRVTLPNGQKSDVLIAHFDKVANLKPGQILPAGSFIGTQGRTGSTTGAHISMDWYQPDGSATPNINARNWFLNNYLRKAK